MESRADRRALQRKANRIDKWIKSLNKEHIEYIDNIRKYAYESNLKDLEVMSECFYVCIRMNLLNILKDINITDEVVSKIEEDVNKEGLLIQELLKKGEIYMAKINEEKGNIISMYEGLIKEGKKHKEALDLIGIKYSQFSNNQIKNIIVQYKKDNAVKSVSNELTTEEALEYIFEEEPKNEKESAKVETKEENIEEPRKLFQPKLKIKKAVIEGEYGSYEIENDKVKSGEETFNNLKEVDEYKQKEIENFVKRIEEIKSIFNLI